MNCAFVPSRKISQQKEKIAAPSEVEKLTSLESPAIDLELGKAKKNTNTSHASYRSDRHKIRICR